MSTDLEGTEGQDRDNYSDTQDRDNYTTEDSCMTTERLQEIKKEIVERFDFDIPAEYDHVIQELITAYENRGELLQLALGNVDKLNATLEEAEDDTVMQHEIHIMLIEDAVSKYEAAQAELAGRKESNKRYHKQMCDKEDERRITRKRLDETEKQLDEAQAEASRCKEQLLDMDY